MNVWTILLVWISLCSPLLGQQPGETVPVSMLTPRVRSFQGEAYGAENQNWDITQSPEGVLFVANSGGVLRYDGLNWSVHQLPARPTVRTVRWHGSRLYVGGYGEFGYFRMHDGQLGSYVSLSNTLPQPEQGEEIWHIEVINDVVVFQSFTRLYWYEGGEVRVEAPGDLMFAHAAHDKLWVPVTGEGIYRYTPAGGKMLLPGSDPGDPVVGVVEAGEGMLVATRDGIHRYRDGEYEAWSDSANRILTGQQINRVLALRSGGVAVGTIMGGVYVFGAGGELEYQLSYGNGLSNNTVLSLFEDRDGNLWAGLDRGLNLIVRSEPLLFYRSGGRPIGATYAAFRYRGQLYVGTNQGLFRYETDRRTFALVPGTAGQVWELQPTPSGLLCGHNDGTFLINGDEARRVSGRSGGWRSMVIDPDSTMFLQANYAGLSRIDLLEPAEERLEGLLAPLRYLECTGEHEVLALHGSRGAYAIELAEDLRSIVAVDTLTEPDLVRPILTRFGDSLLVQTDEGIYHYRHGAFDTLGSFRGVRLTPGLYLLPGREGSQEWFVVQRDRVIPYRGRERQTAFPVSLRRSFPYLTALDDSTYLFSLEEAFALYRTETPPSPEKSPAIMLKLAGSESKDDETILSYGENDVRFTYALPVLDREVRYRSRLLGFSDAWSEWSPLGERSYTNLEEGDYRFEVKADWFGSGARLSFTIRPPWYRTAVAYVVYLLLLAGLVWFFYQQHRHRLELQARRLEAIRSRQLQRQRIEARNEQLEAENKRKSRELANTTLTLAKKNEMLLDLKEELSKTPSASGPPKNQQKLLLLIDRNLNNEEDWAIFESHFNEVHEAYLKRLRQTHPELTSGDLRLAAYLRMDLSSKEIAPLLHISVRGVENKRYRLRKKLDLESNDNLNQYLQEF
ncbi:triple tyrosine motif-containing protein [Lewinella sp. IMCC34191]|uniref:triple tyrosine motif-containing protein n=1 Tax=Lewinella sp. IMCC34191 TaxID=2259172 RepID=UPI000E221A37|nr:triple tyrosine motif-containing protein [Lewinella sp. IMCC34191]